MRISYLLLPILFIFVLVSSIKAQNHSPVPYLRSEQNPDTLRVHAFNALHQAEFAKAITFANDLLRISIETGNSDQELAALICLGQATLMLQDRNNASDYLLRARELGEILKNDSALASVYNGLGLYAANIETDYYRSLSHYFTGLEYARKSNNELLQTIILANISGIYYLKNDMTGIQYAQECYELGHKNHNIYMIFIGALNSSYMHYLSGDNDLALNYIKEAEFVMKQNKYKNTAHLYSLYGSILLNLNRYDEALQYFRNALTEDLSKYSTSQLNAYIGLGKLYLRERKFDDAIKYLEEGLQLSMTLPHAIYRCDIIELLSQSYEGKGSYSNALSYKKLLEAQKDSIMKDDNERLIEDLHIKYRTQLKESELVLLQTKMKEKEQRLIYLLIVILLLVIVSIVVFMMYRRKKMLYLSIVRQRKNAMKQEDQLRHKIKELTEEVNQVNVSAERYNSSLTNEKSDILFQQLEEMMRENKSYMDTDLTREKMAELLGTNRTYLSQIISEHANLNFTQYINNYRIEEAIRILSDPHNSMPLKAICAHIGFRSMTTFYNLFQAGVGMTPAQFRSKNIQIEEKEKNHLSK